MSDPKGVYGARVYVDGKPYDVQIDLTFERNDELVMKGVFITQLGEEVKFGKNDQLYEKIMAEFNKELEKGNVIKINSRGQQANPFGEKEPLPEDKKAEALERLDSKYRQGLLDGTYSVEYDGGFGSKVQLLVTYKDGKMVGEPEMQPYNGEIDKNVMEIGYEDFKRGKGGTIFVKDSMGKIVDRPLEGTILSDAGKPNVKVHYVSTDQKEEIKPKQKLPAQN